MRHDFSDIPAYSNWKTIEPITKGWGNDLKYFIQNHQGEKYLLRISEKAALAKEAEEYAALAKLEDPHLLSSKLISSGHCHQGERTFRLFSWVDGIEILELLPNLSVERQYELGFQAGRNLSLIHQIPAPLDQKPWAEYFNQKIDRNIRRYEESDLQAEQVGQIIQFIEGHRHFLEGRPQTFQHGDYHLGNMLLNPAGKLAIIDYNRLDFGDPWEEFNRLPWTAMESEAFANGLIHAYFQEGIPSLFFPLMALYIASNQMGSLTWALAYGEKELRVAQNQYQKVLGWYQNFSETTPSWFIPKNKMPS